MTHYKKLLNKDYLGGHDIPENGLIVIINKAVAGQIENKQLGITVEKPILYLEGLKPMACNVTNLKHIHRSLGTSQLEEWIGQSIKLVATSKEYNEGSKSFNGKEIRMLDEGEVAIRVDPKPLVIPELTPDITAWVGAIKALKAKNTTFAAIRKKYKLSKDNEQLLIEAIK